MHYQRGRGRVDKMCASSCGDLVKFRQKLDKERIAFYSVVEGVFSAVLVAGGLFLKKMLKSRF